MAVMTAAALLRIAEPPQYFEGYFEVRRQACALFVIELLDTIHVDMAAVDTAVAGLLELPQRPRDGDAPAVLERMASWCTALLAAAKHPQCQPAQIGRWGAAAQQRYSVLVPALSKAAAVTAVEGVVQALRAACDAQSDAGQRAEQAAALLRETAARLAGTGLDGFNAMHIVAAADALDVPWRHLGGGVLQLGWGARARLLKSSFTDRTSTVGSALARDKVAAARMLRLAGLPLAPSAHAANVDAALAIADRIGYPVVVKPRALDGGAGVRTDLRDAGELRQAAEQALVLSADRGLIVERHVEGRDYRLHVVDGELHGVLERQPGSVTGNGVDSVRGLIARQNDERRDAQDDRRHLHAIEIDDEAVRQLRHQSMGLDNVPAAGQVIRLRGAANVAHGGVPVELPLQAVHPDNRLLALRAARALRLDVAGVDLLLPDIGRSWLETGAHVCEVNGQPQMFTTWHRPLVQRLMEGGNGRIPVVVVLGAGGDSGRALAQQLAIALQARGRAVGLAIGRRIWRGEDCVGRAARGSADGARQLLLDPEVQALLLLVGSVADLSGGWPVDRCDLVLFAAPQDTTQSERDSDGEHARAVAALAAGARFLRPTHVACAADDATANVAVAGYFGAARRHALQADGPANIAALRDLLLGDAG